MALKQIIEIMPLTANSYFAGKHHVFDAFAEMEIQSLKEVDQTEPPEI